MKSVISETERLDFILNNKVDWYGYKDYYKFNVWYGGEVIASVEGKTQRECLDKAIQEVKGNDRNNK